jgi:hypothetical protein
MFKSLKKFNFFDFVEFSKGFKNGSKEHLKKLVSNENFQKKFPRDNMFHETI